MRRSENFLFQTGISQPSTLPRQDPRLYKLVTRIHSLLVINPSTTAVAAHQVSITRSAVRVLPHHDFTAEAG